MSRDRQVERRPLSGLRSERGLCGSAGLIGLLFLGKRLLLGSDGGIEGAGLLLLRLEREQVERADEGGDQNDAEGDAVAWTKRHWTQAPGELVAAEAVGVPPEGFVAGVLGALVEPVPAPALAEAVVPVTAGAANVSDTWNCTGKGQPPLLEAAPDVPPPAPESVAELRVTAVTPLIRCSCTIVWATADCDAAQPDS